MIRGTDAILACLPELKEVAERSSQSAELEDLPYFLSRPARIPTEPILLLVYQTSSSPRDGEILGAVMLLRYTGLLTPFRLYTSTNRRGRRTVFAAPEDRLRIAAVAAQGLLEFGAHYLSVDIDLGPDAPVLRPEDSAFRERLAVVALHLRGVAGRNREWSLHPGMKRFDLPLASTYDASLSVLGKRTRRNLRYYDRLARRELNIRFVAQAELGLEPFLALNRTSSHPAGESLARWRYASLKEFPQTFLSGIQMADGTWLSLLGGRRHRGSVEIDWQMNRRGYERFSLTTAMRSMLIEHEVARGSTSLTAEGGTVHSMGTSFQPRAVFNLAARQRSVMLDLLTDGLRRWFPVTTLTQSLNKPWRVWRALPGDRSDRSANKK